MKRMAAINLVFKALVVVTMIATSFQSFAKHPYPVVDMCYLLKNLNKYDGRLIELHSEVRFTEHGRQLFDPRCGDLGVMGLSIDDQQYRNKKTILWIRRIFAQGGRGAVVIIGRPVQKPFDHFIGYFILQGVVEEAGSSGNGVR